MGLYRDNGKENGNYNLGAERRYSFSMIVQYRTQRNVIGVHYYFYH